MHSVNDTTNFVRRTAALALSLSLLAVVTGCRTPAAPRFADRVELRSSLQTASADPDSADTDSAIVAAEESAFEQTDFEVATDETTAAEDATADSVIRQVTQTQSENAAADLIPADGLFESPADAPMAAVSFDAVVRSVLQFYPLVQAAYLERAVADGNQLAAWGEFDTKLKADSENTPLGFYETYRNSAAILQPIYDGGYAFGGYRNGGGSFEPWYLERETNAGGEFKGGFRVPLLRDRDIDARRAEVWRRTRDQQLTNPLIRASLIQFTAEAGRAYWKWVATGQKYQLGVRWLELARTRNGQVRRRVEEGDLDPPVQIDNERAIAKRQAKVADSLRAFEQAAQKLSIYLRDESGQSWVPTLEMLPTFPELLATDEISVETDITRAQQNRPELESLALLLQRLRIDYAEACNFTRPRLDAQLTGAQDVGEPTSSKRDKSEFELEAGLYFEVPVQQRKGRGKMHAVQAKMAQVGAKRRLTVDKITAEVQAAYAGLRRSREAAEQASTALELADQMAVIERRLFEAGQSDLLKVALREQYALDAAEDQVEAVLIHFTAFSDYAASLGFDRPTVSQLSSE